MSNGEWAIVLVTVIFVGIPLAFSACRYTKVRRSEQRQLRFENYHELIHRLTAGYPGEQPWVQCQVATAYELRNYREYREVSIRILENMQLNWKDKEHMQPVVKEISITLPLLKRDTSWERLKNGCSKYL